MRKLAAALVVAALFDSAAYAEEPQQLPDPASIAVPDLSGSQRPEVVREGAKYFFFHRDGVSFERAYADLADCSRFLRPASWESARMTRFVPWVSRPGQSSARTSNPYGLVGAVLAGAFEGGLQHKERQSKLRACMEPRGYVRYGVAEAIWKRVTSLPQEKSIAVQAKIASGPAFGTKVGNR